MAKEIKFTLDLQVNGVSSLVTVKANAEQMAKSIEEATQKTSFFKKTMKSLGETFIPLNSTVQCVQQLQSSMAGLTQESNQFSAAMRAANTMAGKSGKDFKKEKPLSRAGAMKRFAELMRLRKGRKGNKG